MGTEMGKSSLNIGDVAFPCLIAGYPQQKKTSNPLKSHCMTVKKKTENHQHYTNKDHKLSKKTYFTWKFGAPIWGHSLKKRSAMFFQVIHPLLGVPHSKLARERLRGSSLELTNENGVYTQFCLFFMGKLMIIQWIEGYTILRQTYKFPGRNVPVTKGNALEHLQKELESFGKTRSAAKSTSKIDQMPRCLLGAIERTFCS